MPSCDFCHSDFNDKSTLNRHQRTSKTCIKIQEQQNPGKAVEKTIFTCDYCKKELSNYKSKWRHEKSCKLNTTDIVETVKKLQNEVHDLKTQLKSAKTINSNNNQSNNINSNNQIGRAHV